MTVVFLGSVVVVVAIVADYSGRARRWLHIYQLEHYDGVRLLHWWHRRRDLLHPAALLVSVCALIAADALLALDISWAAAVLLIPITIASAVVALREWRRPEKKEFVFTARAKRLFATSLVPAAFFVLVFCALAIVEAGTLSAVALGSLLGAGLLMVIVVPALLITANAALSPVQRRVNGRFVSNARAKLTAVSPITIGITGSFGKTTTKFCVGAVLSTAGETYVTPDSFNSFLGVTRAINEGLGLEHQFFVVEMGAYRKGDIAELCNLTKPKIGILTAIGAMHLERFGSIDAISRAKAELCRGLSMDGHFVTNADDALCRAIAEAAEVPVTLFGIESSDADIRATDIDVTLDKTSFTLHLNEREYPVESHLLGRHNVLNLLAAAACGAVVGIDEERIVRALEIVEAPPHRLARIENRATGITVIDDAYNSNPDGAAAALEILNTHTNGRRVLVTPGMVELGEQEKAANIAFGRTAARVCDFVILVGGELTEPIERGLKDGGLADDRIVHSPDVEHATRELSKIIRAGDIVLFENDLPDTYIDERREG